MKNLLLFGLLVVVFLSVSCSKRTITGIQTIDGKSIVIKAVNSHEGRSAYSPQLGDSIIVRGDLYVFDESQEKIVRLYSNDSNHYVVLGVISDSLTSINQLGTTVMIVPNQNYGIQYSAKTLAGFEYPLDLKFMALVVSGADTTVVNLDQIYQGKTANVDQSNYHQYFGYFVGFQTDEQLNITACGEESIDNLIDLSYHWDGIADSTASPNAGGLIPIPDSLQVYIQEDCNGNMDMIIQCSYSNFAPLPMQWDGEQWSVTIKTLPNSFQNMTITDRNTWEEKIWGIESQTEFGSTELIDYYNDDPESSWYLFLHTIIEGVPYNVEYIDYRSGMLINIHPAGGGK